MSLANLQLQASEARQELPVNLATTQLPIHYRLYGISTRVNIPDLSLLHFDGHAGTTAPYTDYLSEHLAWKRNLFPSLDDSKLRNSCIRELESINLGWPGIDSKNYVLAMAAYLVYICDVDDLIEELDIATAERCIESCVGILGGEPCTDISEAVAAGAFQRTKEYTVHLRQHLMNLLMPSAIKAVFQDIQDMLLGQLPELIHNRRNTPLESFTAYLKLRFHPLGILPIITIADHHHLPRENNTAHSYPDLELLKERMVTLAVVQNDLGGVEKDLARSNRSNAVTALGELAGRPIRTGEEFISNSDILQRAVEEHNILMGRLIEAWKDARKEPCSQGEKRSADMVLNFSVSHLEWTLATQRYAVEGLKDDSRRY